MLELHLWCQSQDDCVGEEHVALIKHFLRPGDGRLRIRAGNQLAVFFDLNQIIQARPRSFLHRNVFAFKRGNDNIPGKPLELALQSIRRQHTAFGFRRKTGNRRLQFRIALAEHLLHQRQVFFKRRVAVQ